jgi:hypothetical protein
MPDKTRDEQEAADMDRALLILQERAYALGWQDVATAADRSRCALRRRLHPEDLLIADRV